jgi:HTH-type transcriptional regulator / antitoxin HipB
MILNERQHGLTQAHLRKFQSTAADLAQAVVLADSPNQKLRAQAHLDAINSQIETLQQELQEYQNLKSGNITKLEFSTLAQLPEALIKARIVRGLTQEQLGALLGLQAQQIQRYESTFYASASLSKILEVQKALQIEIKEEVLFH